MQRVVVVTGVGAVSALGLGATAHYDALVEARTALAVQHHLEVFDIPDGEHMRSITKDHGLHRDTGSSKGVAHFVGGHINPTALLEALDCEDSEKMGRHDLFARWAMEEALKRAGWSPTDALNRSKTGAVVSSAFRNVQEVSNSQLPQHNTNSVIEFQD